MTLTFAVMAVVATWILVSGWAGRSGDGGMPSIPTEISPLCPLDFGSDAGEAAVPDDPVHPVSEAEMDEQARKQAEAIRSETERRLAEIDEIMVWRLNDWRHSLTTLQDMMVQLAGVGTGGGTWVGHEMERNDLELEAGLLEPHAEGLAGNPVVDTAITPQVEVTAPRRMEQWQALWKEFKSSAESLRASPETPDSQKVHLDSILGMASESHALLANKLANLKDAAAAEAVIDFCDCYFTKILGQYSLSTPLPRSSAHPFSPDGAGNE